MSTHNLIEEPQISEEAVVQYLRTHPDFFERQAQLLSVIKLPHLCGGVVSLVERQVSLLREQNRQLDRKLLDLVTVARDNEHLSRRLHHLALSLLEADDLNSVVATAQDVLRSQFKADFVVIQLIARTPSCDPLHAISPQDPALEQFADLFENKRPVCGRLHPEQAQFLFNTQAQEIQSAVMVPLYEGDRIGLLALGSRDEHRFHPGMGTLFLGYLGELISRAITGSLRAR